VAVVCITVLFFGSMGLGLLAYSEQLAVMIATERNAALGWSLRNQSRQRGSRSQNDRAAARPRPQAGPCCRSTTSNWTHGFEDSACEVRVGLCGAVPAPLSTGGASSCPAALQRGATVVATVVMEIPLVVLPFANEAGAHATVGGVDVVASHTSYVDLYRSTSG
jgi:hypothetical protein